MTYFDILLALLSYTQSGAVTRKDSKVKMSFLEVSEPKISRFWSFFEFLFD